MLQAMLARAPHLEPPDIRGWLPHGFLPPQVELIGTRPTPVIATSCTSRVCAPHCACACATLREVSVPLGTHTGWNPRHPATGGRGQVVSLAGSTIAFAPTRAAREASGDPRPSIEERYASKADYLQRVESAARALVAERRVLAEDVADIVAQAGGRYDALARPREQEGGDR